MRARPISKLLPIFALLALVPVATDGGQAECGNVSGSLASTAVGPVNGDESFFKLPTGPANIMLLLDDSGSMQTLPPCGNSWGDRAACRTPTIAAPANPPTLGLGALYTVNGTCHPSQAPVNAAALAWMEAVVPKTEYADPGRSSALSHDVPPWGTGCSGNNCFFDPNAYYRPDGWSTGATAALNYATRVASDTDATLVAANKRGCIALNSSNTPLRDKNGNWVDMGAACQTCMADHGYYFYTVKVVASGTTITTVSNQLLFKGTFLNAFPPKFISARKVIKDVAFLDPSNPTKLDQVRMGLSRIESSATSPARGYLVVPLGPDKVNSFPPTQASFAQARQYIISVLNYDKAVYTDAGGNTIINGADATYQAGFFDPAGNMTPLGTALLNVGQYFTSLNRYNTLLGTGFQTANFNESSAGTTNAPWARTNPNQCSICWGCQNNAVVMISDGAPNSEITMPAAISSYDTPGYTAAANCGTGGTACGSSIVPRVADWLHNADLRADTVMTGKQALVTHTIGVAITKATDPTAYAVLNATANLSGGIFQSANDPQELADSVVNAINQVVPKENSFSAASATSLQTVQTAASQAFLTRFKPNQTPTWEGHVFETFLFDEFLNGCDATQAVQPDVACLTKTVSADFNGDGKCGGVFMIDVDCDEIVEDPKTGDFVKKGLSLPANIAWDAGQVLSDPTKTGYRSADETAANARNIFTYLNGTKVAFTAANAATLLPYLNISTAWCTSFLTQIGVAPGADPRLQCAQNLIYFVRGWDVLNQDGDGCKGPGQSNLATCKSGAKGEERDRANDGNTTPFFWKLGDIFHSSPAIVLVPSDEIRCDTGYDVQCVATLHSPLALPGQTPIQYYGTGTSKIDAYEAYRQDNIGRRRMVLVGANDGMLHAFDAGLPDLTTPADITGSYGYQVGTGEERWALIPTDQLPRLKDLVYNHQYMVDASVMLRDVWVDGTGTEVPTPDRKKQRDEYHTLAVFGRRAGGTAYTALDVTNPDNPQLRWSFPKDCSEDARHMGESWSDFAPRPPPIFPVRLKDGGDTRGYEERWVVGINGGYDPMLNLGRAMFMVDAWQGDTLWRFTDADFKASMGYGSGTSMFPVAAAMGPVDIGDTTKPVRDQDGFFDTATWGDLGGNLWVARFHDPGEIDLATGRVKNWYVARAFEQRRRADDAQSMVGRNEFFYMTANSFESTNHTLRTFLGSGNREQIMSQAATCGTDNLLACCQNGCTDVTATTANSYGACNGTTTFSCASGTVSYTTTTTASCGTGTATCAAAPGNAYSSSLNVHWACPGAGIVPDASGSATCDVNGVCTVTPMPQQSVGGTFTTPSHNRFYGVWAYGKDTKKMFNDAASALAFDKNRFTDVAYGGCTGPRGGTCSLVETTSAKVSYDTSNPLLFNTTCGAGVTKCSATLDDAGWFYEYGRYCPLASCPTAPPWTDEKSGAGATVMLGCTLWGSFRPVGATTSTDPCSGSLGTPAAYSYTAHFASGTPNPSQCGTLDFATQRPITSPPNAAIMRVTFFNGSGGPPGPTPPPPPPGPPTPANSGCGGGISYGALSLDPGSSPTNTPIGTRTCAMEPIYFLEVPREAHTCRHVDPTTCE